MLGTMPGLNSRLSSYISMHIHTYIHPDKRIQRHLLSEQESPTCWSPLSFLVVFFLLIFFEILVGWCFFFGV